MLSDQLYFGAIIPCLGGEVELYLGAEPQAQSYTVIFVPADYWTRLGHKLKQTLQPELWKTKLLNEDSVEPITNEKTPNLHHCVVCKNETENETHCYILALLLL